MSVRVSNISAMRAIPTTSFNASLANTVYVDTVGDFFKFSPGSALPPVSNFIVSSSDGSGQWFRMGIPNQSFLAALFWAIDPVSGDDENVGWGATQANAEASPLKTIREFNRRLAGNPGYDSPSQTLVRAMVSIMGNVPLTDDTPATNFFGKNNTVVPLFVGKLGAPVTTGTVSNYVTHNVGAGTGATYLMDLTSAASYVGMMVQDQDNRYCFVLAADSANVARVSIPMTEPHGSVTLGHSPEPGDLVNGKTFAVYDLYTLPSHPYASTTMAGFVVQLKVGSGITNHFDNANLGGSNTYYIKCMIEGSNGLNGTAGCWVGGFNVWSGCLFRDGGSHGIAFLHHAGSFHCAAFLGVRAIFINGSGSVFQEGLMIYNSTVLMDETSSLGAVTGTTPRLQVGIFAVSGTAFSGGRLRLPSDGGTVYGAFNTGTLFQVPQGSSYTLPKAGCTAATSGAVLSVGGTSKAFSDIPFINTTNNACITDGP